MLTSKIHNLDDYITGNKFKDLCDSVYLDANHPVTEDSHIIFCYTDNVPELFEYIKYFKGPFVLITHNSDVNIQPELFATKPACIKKWFAQNINVAHPDLIPIPIGIANKEWPHGNFEVIKNKLEQDKRIRNVAFLCFKADTNPNERIPCWRYFNQFAWVTKRVPYGQVPFDQYVDDVYNHLFTISPQGNGIDCLRTWESIYLGTIPIVKRCVLTEYYKNLPIAIVDDWSEVTGRFIKEQYDKIYIEKGDYNLEQLFMPYWKEQILGALNG